MAENEKKNYIKIGKRYKVKEGMAFECGLLPKKGNFQAYCFKDEEVYLNEPDEICYVDDLSFHKWFDLIYNGKISEEEEEMAIENCENDELQIFIWDEERRTSGLYKTSVLTHKSILAKCVEFLRKNPEYNLDPEDLAYRVFLDIDSALITECWFKGTPLEEPDSFTAAAITLLK